MFLHNVSLLSDFKTSVFCLLICFDIVSFRRLFWKGVHDKSVIRYNGRAQQRYREDLILLWTNGVETKINEVKYKTDRNSAKEIYIAL